MKKSKLSVARGAMHDARHAENMLRQNYRAAKRDANAFRREAMQLCAEKEAWIFERARLTKELAEARSGIADAVAAAEIQDDYAAVCRQRDLLLATAGKIKCEDIVQAVEKDPSVGNICRELRERIINDGPMTLADLLGWCNRLAEQRDELAAALSATVERRDELLAALIPFGAIDLVESRLPAEFAMLVLRARAAIASVKPDHFGDAAKMVKGGAE